MFVRKDVREDDRRVIRRIEDFPSDKLEKERRQYRGFSEPSVVSDRYRIFVNTGKTLSMIVEQPLVKTVASG